MKRTNFLLAPPKVFLYPFAISLSLPCPRATTDLFFLSLKFGSHFLELYKSGIKQHILFCVFGFFTQHKGFEILYVVGCINSSLFLKRSFEHKIYF